VEPDGVLLKTSYLTGWPAPCSHARMAEVISSIIEYVPPVEPPLKVTDGEIYEAICECRGNLSKVANHLGVTRRRISQRVERNPGLMKALEEYRDDRREEIKDIAEEHLFADVEKGDATNVRFALQTLGKDRGFSTGVVGTGKGGEIIVQISRLAQEAPDE